MIRKIALGLAALAAAFLLSGYHVASDRPVFQDNLLDWNIAFIRSDHTRAITAISKQHEHELCEAKLIVERRPVLNAADQNHGYVSSVSMADSGSISEVLIDFLFWNGNSLRGFENLAREDGNAAKAQWPLSIRLRELFENVFTQSRKLRYDSRADLNLYREALPVVLEEKAKCDSAFSISPDQGRSLLDAFDRHPRALLSDERLLGQSICFSVRERGLRGVNQHSHQQSDFEDGHSNLRQGEPSQILCSFSHAPLLAQVLPIIAVSLFAGIFLWRGIGFHVDDGRLSGRAVSWISLSLLLMALAVILCFVLGETYKYKREVDCNDHANYDSSSLSV
ncbi:MAG: hypothetical protein AAF543_12950 [Pseudomonadota bacterium]